MVQASLCFCIHKLAWIFAGLKHIALIFAGLKHDKPRFHVSWKKYASFACHVLALDCDNEIDARLIELQQCKQLIFNGLCYLFSGIFDILPDEETESISH